MISTIMPMIGGAMGEARQRRDPHDLAGSGPRVAGRPPPADNRHDAADTSWDQAETGGASQHDRAGMGVLAEAIRERRRDLGLRQQDLADLAECSVRSVYALEHGKATVRLDKLLAVLDVLGLGLTVGDRAAGRIERGDS